MMQYVDGSPVPQIVLDVVANKISLLDQYVLFQTGPFEYTALIYQWGANVCTEYRFTLDESASVYSMVQSEAEFVYTVVNECCVYSNVGYGMALDLPVVDLSIAYSVVILACALMLAIVFKGAVYPCLRRK